MKLTINKCSHCGNNPINHRATFIAQSLIIFLTPFSIFIAHLKPPFSSQIFDIMTTFYMRLFELFGLIRLNDDIKKAVTQRTRVIWEEAEKRDIKMQSLVILGKPVEQYRAKVGGLWRYFESLPIPPNYKKRSYVWLDDKWVLKKFFRKRGVPVAFGGGATSFTQALKIFKKGKPPFITKPRLGSRGRHVTTFIYTKNQLRDGFGIAKEICPSIVVEEQLFGSVYRGTYIGGEVVGLLRGDPPQIIGNGKDTIRKLIIKKNKNKHPRVKKIMLSGQVRDFLAKQKLTLLSVPPQGKIIDLSEKIGISYGGISSEDINKAHPKILLYIKRAGDLLKIPVVGFDFIIEDITKDPDKQHWGIIEANSLPFIDLHHFPLQGTPVNAAAKIWDLWNSKK